MRKLQYSRVQNRNYYLFIRIGVRRERVKNINYILNYFFATHFCFKKVIYNVVKEQIQVWFLERHFIFFALRNFAKLGEWK